MKNILKSSLYVFVFAAAGIMFQIACSNSDDSNLNATAINKVIYIKNMGADLHIYTCNYDGSNQTEIPLDLPAGIGI